MTAFTAEVDTSFFMLCGGVESEPDVIRQIRTRDIIVDFLYRENGYYPVDHLHPTLFFAAGDARNDIRTPSFTNHGAGTNGRAHLPAFSFTTTPDPAYYTRW